MTNGRTIAACGLSLLVCAWAGEGRADDAPWPRLGGHVGAVLPLYMADASGSHGISDFVTIAIAAGVTVKLSDVVAVDFETVVGEPLVPKGGTTGLTVNPGLVFDLGPIALGLRLAYQVGAPPNIGAIPLVHKGLPLGPVSWFIEADFPVFDEDGQAAFTAALHTGVGF